MAEYIEDKAIARALLATIEGYGPQGDRGPLNPGAPAGPIEGVTPTGQITVEPYTPPVDLKATVDIQGRNILRSLDTLFQRARQGTMESLLPSTVPQDAPLRTVAEFTNPIPGSLPQAIGSLAAMAIPGAGLRGPLLRAGGAGTAAGVTAAAQGNPEFPLIGLEQALGQLSMELPFSAGRAVLGQRRAAQTYTQEQAAIAHAQAAKEAFPAQQAAFQQSEQARRAQTQQAEIDRINQYRRNKVQFTRDQQARTWLEETSQATTTAAYNETQAGHVAATVKSQVPAWKDLGNSAKDLWNMAFGTDWKLVQNRYDAALKDVVKAGRGRFINMRRDAAEVLGLAIPDPEKIPGKGALGPGPGGQPADLTHVMVDAGELANAMTGKWSNRATRGAYRQGARALDEAGIGDPESRGEYRNASAFRMVADKSQMLQDKVFHPDKLLRALGTLRAGTEVLGPRQNVDLFTTLDTASVSRTPNPTAPPGQFPPFQRGPAFQPGTPPTPPTPAPAPTVTHGPLGVTSPLSTILGVGSGIAGAELMRGSGMGHALAGYFGGHALGQGLGSRIQGYRGGPPVPPPGVFGRGARAVGGEMATQDIQQMWDLITSTPDSETK